VTTSLAGKRVVVTRPADKAIALANLLEERGATAVIVPMIAIADPHSWSALDAALEGLSAGKYEWIVFTSVNAVEKTLSRFGKATPTAKVAAVGAVTGDSLNDHGMSVDLIPEEFTGEALADALGPGDGRILLPRVEGAPRATVEALESRGWTVDEVIAYRSIAPEAPPVQLTADDFDALTFASGSAARNFAKCYDGDGLLPSRDKVVVCIGPQTAEAARAAGLQVDVVAATHTDEGIVDALEDWYSSSMRI
jgi:uroporphyrinogen III methyltransferase/synthase